MKKIYAVTFESEDYPSGRFDDNLRLMAAMVYEYVYNFIGDEVVLLNINKNIVHNNMHYARYSNHTKYKYDDINYMMDSDMYDDGYINYEPFIVGKKTFALTIMDDMYGIEFLENVIQYNLNLLRLNYKFKIDIFPYESKNIDDESQRDEVVNQMYNKYAYGRVRRNKFVRLLKKGFCRNNIGVCGR